MRLVLLIGLTLLSGCGARQTLKPAPGASLPPKPYAATSAPTADELIAADVQARPDRNDDLLRRSEQRRDDKFDLPPPG